MERLLARRERQGLTFRELSEESGIAVPTLSWWASKLRRESAEPEARLVPVEVLDEGGSGSVTIELGSGLRLVVEPGFDAEQLARVVSALSSAC